MPIEGLLAKMYKQLKEIDSTTKIRKVRLTNYNKLVLNNLHIITKKFKSENKLRVNLQWILQK